jgi:hypothetical protein
MSKQAAEEKDKSLKTEEHDDLDFDVAFEAAAVSEEPPKKEEEPPKKEEEPPAKEEEPPKKEEEPDLAAKLAEEQAETERLRRELEAAKAEPPKKEEEPPAKEEPKEFKFSDEEKETLDSLKDEWPMFAQGIELKMNELEHRIMTRIEATLGEALTKVNQTIEPVIKTQTQTAEEQFRTAVQEKHDDAVKIFPDVKQWANSLPGVKGKVALDVLKSGTAQEVIELFDDYKLEKGITKAPEKNEEPEKKPDETPPTDDKGKRLDQMEGVRKERTGVIDEDDLDFDTAFERAAGG